MPEIVTRKEGKARGSKRYFTGLPCLNGHVAERIVSNGRCWKCQSEWARKNPRDRTEQMAAWREKNKDILIVKKRKYHSENRDRINAKLRDKHKERYEKYRAKYLVYRRERQAKIGDLLAVLRKEMPQLLKEFGL